VSIETSIIDERPAKPLPPPGFAPTKMWMAAIVPLCAVVMLAVIIIINIATAEPPAAVAPSPKLEKVSGLSPSTTNPFVPLVVAGEPPGDVLGSVVIPAGSIQTAIPQVGGDPTGFDHTIDFTSPASEQAIYSYFDHEMTGRGWKVFSKGAPANQPGVEVLAQRAGSDGWYWEEGVVVSPTAFGANGSQSTRYSVRLYQASEDD
jgi:hypothetical protein